MVSDGDIQCDLGQGRARSLLALLVLHRNEVLSVDRIIEALWGDDPPAAARSHIEDDIGRLRELVGDAVVTRPWGCGLRTSVGSVDLDDFERLVSRARSEQPAVAEESLRDALALWRGLPLSDLPDTSFASDEIARLQEARSAAEAALLELSTRAQRGLDSEADPAETAPRRRLRPIGQKRWKVAATCAAVIAVAAIGVVWGIAPGESRHVATGPNMVAALDPEANRVVDAFTVGSIPSNVAVGGDKVWTYNANDKTVSLIDPRTRLVRTVPTGGAVSSLGAGPSGAWVGNGWSGTVSRIDPDSAEVVRTIRLPGERYTAASFIAASPSDVWVSGVTLPANAPSPLKPPPDPPPPPANFPKPHRLAWRIDPRTNRVTRTMSLAGVELDARTLVISGDWILLRGDYGLAAIDRRTARVKVRLRLPSHGCCETAGLTVGAGSIWVVGLASDLLWRIDPNGGGVVKATIRLPGQPAAVVFADGAVWVADANGAILKIDPKRNEIVKRIPITGVPHSLAFGLGRLWVALD